MRLRPFGQNISLEIMVIDMPNKICMLSLIDLLHHIETLMRHFQNSQTRNSLSQYDEEVS